jgi:hypothetical protein
MDQIQSEFSKNIILLQKWYQLFASFTEEDMSSIRRDIILENLTYQMLSEENRYKEKMKNTFEKGIAQIY